MLGCDPEAGCSAAIARVLTCAYTVASPETGVPAQRFGAPSPRGRGEKYGAELSGQPIPQEMGWRRGESGSDWKSCTDAHRYERCAPPSSDPFLSLLFNVALQRQLARHQCRPAFFSRSGPGNSASFTIIARTLGGFLASVALLFRDGVHVVATQTRLRSSQAVVQQRPCNSPL